MRPARCAVVVAAACAVIAAALLAGGGVYRTVNAGRGRVYVVNRFTGRAFPIVVPKPPEPKPDPAARAVELVQRERADRWFPMDGSARGPGVGEYVKQAMGQARGRAGHLRWTAQRQPDGLYVVSVGVKGDGAEGRGLGWEVDVESEVVRFINGDRELAKYYGFKPMPTAK